jgi:predicted ATPase
VDEATINLARHLGRRIATTRTLLIVTFRDDELGTDHPLRVLMGDLASVPWVRRMALLRLSPDAVTDMAAGQPVDPAALYRVTGGNPFFVREVLRTGDADVPASVRDMVLRRTARLGPRARSTLDAASVLGVRVEPELLRAIQVTGSLLRADAWGPDRT